MARLRAAGAALSLVLIVVSVIVSLATYKENPEIQQEFTASEDMVHSFK